MHLARAGWIRWRDEVPELIQVLRGGLRTAYDRHRGLLESAFADDTGDIDAPERDGSLAG